MADESGALNSNYDGQDLAPAGGRDIARGLAYGASGSNQMFQGALSALVDPERSAQTERQAFWAGMTGPQTGGMSGVSNAMSAQVAARDAQDKLRAAYIPMIMQTMTQQRANDLGYAKFAQDRAEKVTPLINSSLYGMQGGDTPPDLATAHKRIDETGAMFGMGPQELLPHHIALHHGAGSDGKNISSYLQQLRTAAAPAAEGITKFGTNAAGQTTTQNPVKGTVGLPATATAEDGAVNPTKTGVEIDKQYRQDPGKYTEDLTGTMGAYNDILQRGNAIQSSLNSFSPGKYSNTVSGLAAATKDLQKMFPNATTSTLNNYVTSLMGSKGDGTDANPVAAAQFAESLKTQETLAQLKASLDGAGRIGQQEFRSLNAAMLGVSSDPAAFSKFMDFTRGRAANVANKLKSWGEFAKAKGNDVSVPAFEIPWSVNEATQLIGSKEQPPKAGQLEPPANVQRPAVASPTQASPLPNQPGSPVMQTPQRPAAPQQASAPAPVQRAPIDLRNYEPGTKVGPTGIPYVLDHGVPRPARSRQVSGQVQ
jgi:hypothetical protein